MNRWFKDHIIHVFSFTILYIGLMLFFVYPRPYELLLPGGVDSAEHFIEIDHEYQSSGSFNSSYVSVVTKPSYFQYLLAKNNDKAVIIKMSKQRSELSVKEINESDHIDKVQSIYESIIAAYKKADKPLTYKQQGVKIVYRYLNYKAFEKLEIGDVITQVNHKDVNSLNDIATQLKDTGCDAINLTVIRNDKTINFDVEKTTVNGVCYVGLSENNTATNFSDFQSTPSFKIIDYRGYGPSAGLIQALSVYNALTPTDITYGLDIAGTGTIDVDGNVGPIGGIQQKVFGACKAHVDIFFAPDMDDGTGHNLYLEALKAKAIMKSDINIVPVKTIDDAINYLEEHYGNG